MDLIDLVSYIHDIAVNANSESMLPDFRVASCYEACCLFFSFLSEQRRRFGFAEWLLELQKLSGCCDAMGQSPVRESDNRESRRSRMREGEE